MVPMRMPDHKIFGHSGGFSCNHTSQPNFFLQEIPLVKNAESTLLNYGADADA
jgi:hypothetical protein